MIPFSISCTTCSASLRVRRKEAIGRILACPKCGSMIRVALPLAVPSAPSSKAISDPCRSQVQVQAEQFESALDELENLLDPKAGLPRRASPPSPAANPDDIHVSATAKSEQHGNPDEPSQDVPPTSDDIENPTQAALASSAYAGFESAKINQLKLWGMAVGSGLITVAIVTGLIARLWHGGNGDKRNTDVAQLTVSKALKAGNVGKDDSSDSTSSEIVREDEADEPKVVDLPHTDPKVRAPDGPVKSVGKDTRSAAPEPDDSTSKNSIPELVQQPKSASPSITTKDTEPSPKVSFPPNESGQLAAGPLSDNKDAGDVPLIPRGAVQTRYKPIVRAPAPTVDMGERLNRTIASVDISGMPLGRFLSLVTQLGNVPVSIDPLSFQLGKLSATSPVSASGSQSSLRNILAEGLEPHRLAAVARDYDLLIVRKPFLSMELRRLEHGIEDLVVERANEAEELARVIERLTRNLDASGLEACIPSVDGVSLQVAATVRQHAGVHQFLNKLRAARGLSNHVSERGWIPLETGKQRGMAFLMKEVRIRKQGQLLLREYLQLLAKQISSAWLIVDWDALGLSGHTPTSKIEVRETAMPLGELLHTGLGPLGLAFRVVDEKTIQITSREAWRYARHLEFHRIDGQDRDTNSAVDLMELENALDIDSEQPDSGGIHFDAPSGCLIAALPSPKHDQLRELLDKSSSNQSRGR